MRLIIPFLMGILLNFPGSLQSELINQPVVNLYLNPQEDTEVETQAIYATPVTVLETTENGWAKVEMPDEAQGWLPLSQLIADSSYEQTEQLKPVKNLFAHIYRVTDTTPYPPLLTVPYGTFVKLDNPVDTGERWVQMELVTGEKAWIQRGDIDFNPQPKTLAEMIGFSKKFLGLPYTWAGTSSYGFDCSGFVQMLFKEMGVLLPRNSRDQAASDLLVSVSREELKPGDLVFFGKTRITHVGLYLGNNEFIHSGVTESPIVMISNLQNEKYSYLTARRLKM